ncbi:HD-GYP domain-containing protein [Sulfurimonas sp.]|uniref:HD-GYP domain-containing protein n=1 Tax=Sulfurimonas sp. TaxID=2022749 RepID=UPI00356544B1
MFKKFKNNSLILFFIRLIGVFIIVTFLGFVGIYKYYEHEQAKEIDVIINKGLQAYATEMMVISSLEKELEELSKKTQSQIDSGELLRIELIDSNKKTLLNKSTSLPSYIEEMFESLSIEQNKKASYHMIPMNNGAVALIFTKLLHIEHMPDLQIKIALPISKETIESMRNKMRDVFISISIILLLVVFAIFPIIYRQYRDLKDTEERLLSSNIDTILALGNAIALRDSDTNAHNYRVTYYTIRIAEVLKVPKDTFVSLINGALLHDIGKIGITDTILLKPGPLNETEFKQMQQHVELGVEMLTPLSWLYDAIPIIKEHHEKYDGSGYPHGLKGEEISLVARIFAVADVFDALCSNRPYKEAFTLERSLELLREGSGTHFDPLVLEAFYTIATEVHLEMTTKNETELLTLLTAYLESYWHRML